ncbi:phage tail-collar fiber domain-containing protein [Mannheimia pernigra]|uniref:phage tail-collar fiber domain-containing protein n=1 Tax=Mannheimia pernigra TaxID=111844 RepID=UPI001315D9C8|nr:phage tail protein [Mannheimia pernigra]QHB17876.1 hypothetical protein GM695_07475 [Mannheimia pernigra]
MAQFHSVLTNYGVTAFAKAISTKQPLNILKMAVGDGNGRAVTPDSSRTALVREVYRANINSIKLDVRNNKQVIFELTIPEDVGGFYIREMGIFDHNEKLVAIANTPESYKPQLTEGSGKVQVLRMILLVSSSDSVSLTVDNSLIWAKRSELTPKDLDENSQSIIEENGHSHRLPIATLLKKGITKLFSGLDSDAEDMAATPKAIKALKSLIDAITRNLGNYIPNSKKSNTVNSNSADTVATSLAVKTAYDKGVEAKNKADEALGVANTKQSPATTLAGYGITDFVVQSATGDLNTYRTDGIYSFNSRSTATNAPPNKTGHLIVITGGPGNERWCRQIFRTHYTGENYERWQTSGSNDNWSDWQRTDITLNNTLTSTATDQALTAAQGKVLKDLIDTVQGIANSNAGAGHLHVIAEITGLQQALNGKADSNHRHGISEITGLQQALNGKANSSHRHGISEITGLQQALNGKANSNHRHGISDITDLQAALNGKANSNHRHGISEITGLQNALNGKANNATTLAGYGITDGVRQDEFVYQKIGNFEISKYPDGRMIQTYVYEQYDIIPERSRLQNFRWAIAFAERPLVMAQVTTSMNEAHDAGVNITSGSNNTQVYYHLYEHSHPDQGQCRIQFLGVGKWK